MEWWDRRSGLSAVSPTDRDGRGHSPTDLAYVRGVHRDHRKWPITAPHSPLPVSRSCPARGPSFSLFEDFQRFISRRYRWQDTRTWKLPGDGTTGWRFFSRTKATTSTNSSRELPGSKKIVTRVYHAYMLLLSIVFSGGEGERFVSIKRKLRVLIFFVNPSFCIVQR